MAIGENYTNDGGSNDKKLYEQTFYSRLRFKNESEGNSLNISYNAGLLKIGIDQILDGFKYDNKIISHRVVDKVERNGKIYYETKGDANDQRDGALIDKEKVLGKTLFRIKYIGLPSIWLNELFN